MIIENKNNKIKNEAIINPEISIHCKGKKI